MDAEVVAQLMISQQLLNAKNIMTAQSVYNKNCLILEKVQLMDVQTLAVFCGWLKANESQTKIGETLFNGLLTTRL